MAVGSRPLEIHPDQHPPFPFHRLAVVVPVRVLPGDLPVVLDEGLHRVRQRKDRRRPLGLQPGAVPVVADCAEGGARVPAEVADLVRGLSAAHDHPAGAVDTGGDGRELRPTVSAHRGQDHSVMLSEERTGLIKIHAPQPAIMRQMPSLPRVLHLTSSFPRWAGDAVAPYLLELGRAQTDAGMAVSVLAPHAAGAARQEQIDGIHVSRFRYAPGRLELLTYRGGLMTSVRTPAGAAMLPGFLAAFALSARRAAQRWQPDLVHAHWWLPAGLVGAFMTRSGRHPPLVVTLHGSDVHLATRSSGLRRLAAITCGRAAAVTAVSDSLRSEAIAELGIPPDRITTLRMPVRAGTGPPAALPPYPPLRLIAAGRLAPEKGLDVLIDAVALLTAEGDDVWLEIVGAGPLDHALRARARPLDGRVRFRPPCAPVELGHLIAMAHAVVAPSRREGLGLVALEALANGRPVVASRVGGLVEAICDGDDGVLVAPDDPAALAAALRHLPTVPPLGRSLSRHRPEVVASAHLELYRKVLG